MNVVILEGVLSSPPVERELPSGTVLVSFEVTTREGDAPADSAPVSWPDAPAYAATLEAGAAVVVTGRIRRRFFRAGGATASRTEVVADAVIPAAHRRRVARARDAALARAGAAASTPEAAAG